MSRWELNLVDKPSHVVGQANERFDHKKILVEDFEIALGNIEKQLRAAGFINCVVNRETAVTDFSGIVYAVAVDYFSPRAGDYKRSWIRGVNKAGVLRYEFGDARKFVLATQELSTDFDEAWLLAVSKTNKIVKSRPAFMYPQLFDLPYQEVWPKGAKVMVIGDPYQACDKENTTIIEYEYADEIVPPIIRWHLEGKSEEDVAAGVTELLRDLYFEDIRALNSPHHPYGEYRGNPYVKAVEAAIDLIGKNYALALTHPDQQSLVLAKLQLSPIKHTLRKLIDGTWAVHDVAHYFDKDQMDDVQAMFLEKETTRNMLGDPNAFREIIGVWNSYLDNLPRDISIMPEIAARIPHVREWIREMPHIRSYQRLNVCLMYLQDFYAMCVSCADFNTENSSVYNSAINDTMSTGLLTDSPFGAFIPGKVLGSRSQKFLQNIEFQLESVERYREAVAPRLHYLFGRMKDTDLAISAKQHILRSYEHPLVVNYLARRRAKKSVPLHGFFPYEMPVGLEPQDRILALTSVSMHGWNSLERSGFEKDIRFALRYLSVGGKYILGPINQRIFFGSSYSEFHSDELCLALELLASEGLVSYEFHGIKRGNNIDEDGESYDENGTSAVLQNNEAAASLVITRLR